MQTNRKGKQLETEEIKQRISAFFGQELPRLRNLKNYYRGRHAITYACKDPGKPDNRLVNNFCKNITDSTVGYLMGKPVTYSSDDKEMLHALREINLANDEEYVNSCLCRDLSVYGRAFELLFYDESRRIRFVPMDPLTVIPVYAGTVDRVLAYAIRLVSEGDTETGTSYTVEVYDDHVVTLYRYDTVGNSLVMQRKVPHYFGQVPVNVYYNNADGTGDFEAVLSLVDAYNTLQSESVNDFELFADSYLAISGMGGTDASDLETLRRNRVLLLDDGGDAKWLTKSVNDAYIENLKNRIAKDIYRFSGSVDMSEADLGGAQLSGVAMRFRLLNFENRVSVTERQFKRGLQRRYDLICAFLNLLGARFDAHGLTMVFARNIPESPSESADYIEKLSGLVSKKTLLERVPFVEDVSGELERIKEEAHVGEMA